MNHKVSPLEFTYTKLESVVIAEGCSSALLNQVRHLECERVFVMASRTLRHRTPAVKTILDCLDGRLAGEFAAVGAHTPRSDVMAAIAAAREAQADLLVSIGGGSIIDAAKVVQFALSRNISQEQELVKYARFADGSRGPEADSDTQSVLRQIALPTTLSGAEFSNNAGVTDTLKSLKEGYRGPDLCPQIIIYDPSLALHTPEWLWLSTAIRSLDHAIEGYCSKDANPYLDGQFLSAMSLFARSLPMTHADPEDLIARSQSQQATWLACCGLGRVAHGASHGIGYLLGAVCGVPHGYTSCVMLPAVLAWNEEVNRERQRSIAQALGKPGLTASQAVKELISALGLPVTLQSVGVKPDQLQTVAELASQHPVVRNNPKLIETAAEVREILQLAWD